MHAAQQLTLTLAQLNVEEDKPPTVVKVQSLEISALRCSGLEEIPPLNYT